jgi:hypothetical protein
MRHQSARPDESPLMIFKLREEHVYSSDHFLHIEFIQYIVELCDVEHSRGSDFPNRTLPDSREFRTHTAHIICVWRFSHFLHAVGHQKMIEGLLPRKVVINLMLT